MPHKVAFSLCLFYWPLNILFSCYPFQGNCNMLNLISLCWIWEVPRHIWRSPVFWLCPWYLHKDAVSFPPAPAAPCRCSMHSAVMDMGQMAWRTGSAQCMSPRGLYSAFLPLCLLDGVSSKEPLELQHSWVTSPSFPMRLVTWKGLTKSDNAFWKMDGEILAMHNACFPPRTKPKVILVGCQWWRCDGNSHLEFRPTVPFSSWRLLEEGRLEFPGGCSGECCQDGVLE